MAIFGIMGYHSLLGWASGGFITVNAFFVLSGFLITGLLLKEWGRTGSIRLRSFWARRARRLLPALLVLLVGVAFFAWLIAAPDQRGSIRTNALATMLYVANWHQIFSGQSYFALSSAPSPLLHTWTLAIEEQFYLVWPLVVLGVLHFRRSLRQLLALTIALAIASAVWMAVLYHPGADPSRLYYGTDTRAQDVLVGATLAIVLAMYTPKLSARGRRQMAMLGVLAAAAIATEWIILPAHAALPYRGGFLLSDVLFAIVILCLVTAPHIGLAWLFSKRPLVYIGTITYSLYLWHWPVDIYLNTPRTGLSGWQLFGVRTVVAGVIAAASTHWIENPIRLGTFRPWKHWTWTATPVAVLATFGVVMIATIAPTSASVTNTALAPHSSSIKFLLVGDSQAMTLGQGLSVDANEVGVQLVNRGIGGCDFDQGIPSRVPVKIRGDGNVVGVVEDSCPNWPTTWTKLVHAEHPAVVGLLMGRLDVYDRFYQGHWVHIGESAWDNHITYALNLAVKVLSSSGAKVVLFTIPYVSPAAGNNPNGTEYVEDQPHRVDLYNDLVRKVASQHPGTVTVYDLNKEFSASKDVYTSTIDGQVVRTSDGIHFTEAAGEIAGRQLLPLVTKLALEPSH